MQITHWNIDPVLKREMLAHYKAPLAASWAGDAESIMQEFTFDDEAHGLTLDECRMFVRFVERAFLARPLSGIGIEMGAGPGTWSALIAQNPSVEKIYALDACEPIVALAPRVISHLLPNRESAVVPVVGEFDSLELSDCSIDFAFDFFSLHHSPNLDVTLREMHRVLKQDGIVLCFDKARSDAMTDAELQELLDTEYSDAFKAKMGVAAGVRHTRRMNGEHEYRRKDWETAFKAAGFRRFEHFNIARTASGNPLVAQAKKLFSYLPPRMQARLTRLFVPASKPGVTISADHRVYSRLIGHFPKEISLMIATK